MRRPLQNAKPWLNFLKNWLLMWWLVLQGTGSPVIGQEVDDGPAAGPSPSVVRELFSPADNFRGVHRALEEAESELRAPHPVLYEFLKARQDMQANPGDRQHKARYERRFAEATDLLNQRLTRFVEKEADVLKAIQRVSEEAAGRIEQVDRQLKDHQARIAAAAEKSRRHSDTLNRLKKVQETGALTDDQIADARVARSDLDAEFAARQMDQGAVRTIAERKQKLEEITAFCALNANMMRVRFRTAHNDVKVLNHIAALRSERTQNQVIDAETRTLMKSLETQSLHGLPRQMSQLQNLIDDTLLGDDGQAGGTPVENPARTAMEQEFRNLDEIFRTPELGK